MRKGTDSEQIKRMENSYRSKSHLLTTSIYKFPAQTNPLNGGGRSTPHTTKSTNPHRKPLILCSNEHYFYKYPHPNPTGAPTCTPTAKDLCSTRSSYFSSWLVAPGAAAAHNLLKLQIVRTGPFISAVRVFFKFPQIRILRGLCVNSPAQRDPIPSIFMIKNPLIFLP